MYLYCTLYDRKNSKNITSYSWRKSELEERRRGKRAGNCISRVSSLSSPPFYEFHSFSDVGGWVRRDVLSEFLHLFDAHSF